MTLDELIAALAALVEQASAEGRDLSDEEVAEVAELERKIERSKQTSEIMKRAKAYETVQTARPATAAVNVEADKLVRFQEFLRTGDRSLGAEFRAAPAERQTRAQGEASPAAGGYLVPNTYRDKIVECMFSFGGVAAEAETYNSSDGSPVSWVTVSDGASDAAIAARAGITPEASEFTYGGDLVFGEATLSAYKYTTTGPSSDPLRVSVELLQDSRYDLDALIRKHFANRIARAQARHWATGTGVSQPQGILVGTADVELVTANSLANAANGYAKLLQIVGELDTAYYPNAKWVMNKTTWMQVLAIVDSAGRPLIEANAESGISNGVEKKLLGYPVVLDESFPDPADDVNFMVFGDIRQAYVIRRVADLTVVVNPWTRAEFGQVEYTGWERADGMIQDRCAYVLVKGKDA